MGFEGLTEAEHSQTFIDSIATVAEAQMHTSIRARIDAIEQRVRQINSED